MQPGGDNRSSRRPSVSGRRDAEGGERTDSTTRLDLEKFGTGDNFTDTLRELCDETAEEGERFVTVTPEFYPELERSYGARATEWKHARLLEVLRHRDEDDDLYG